MAFSSSTKKSIKRVQSRSMELDHPTGSLSNPKRMFLPPNDFIESDNATSLIPSSYGLAGESNILAILKENGVIAFRPENWNAPVASKGIRASEKVDNEGEHIVDEAEAEEVAEEDGQEFDGEISEDDGAGGNEDDVCLCCRKCRDDRERSQRTTMRLLTEILTICREGRDHGGTPRQLDLSLLPPMPFNTAHDLEAFDRALIENREIHDQFVRKIEAIGGKSVQKAVKFAMESIITDELSQKVVWLLGREDVLRVSKLRLPYIVIDIIRNQFEGMRSKTVQDRIADWLRRGGDRLKAARLAIEKRQR